MLNIKKNKNEDDLTYLERVYIKTLKKDPRSFFYLPLASVYYRKGRIKSAIQVLKKGLLVHSNYVTAKSYLAFLCYECGEIEEAVELFKKVAIEAPDNYVAHKVLARYYTERKDKKRALVELKELERLDLSNRVIQHQINKVSQKSIQIKVPLNSKIKAVENAVNNKKPGGKAFHNMAVLKKQTDKNLPALELGDEVKDNICINQVIDSLKNWLKVIDKMSHKV